MTFVMGLYLVEVLGKVNLIHLFSLMGLVGWGGKDKAFTGVWRGTCIGWEDAEVFV